MEYVSAVCLGVLAFLLIREGWFSLSRLRSWKRSLDRLDKLEWTRVVATLRTSDQD